MTENLFGGDQGSPVVPQRDISVGDLVEVGVNAESPEAFNSAMEQLLARINTDPSALRELEARRDDLLSRLDGAKTNIAGVSAKLAVATLATAEAVPLEAVYRADLSKRTPATEVALAAFHILRYAGDMVPIKDEDIEAALDAPDAEPDFGSYPVLYAAAIAHLHTAAYYLLNPADSFAALASEPPQQETFPPLPFPRVWIEMKHLQPYMRFHDPSDDRSTRYSTIDVLGVGIAEVEAGRVWDIIVPFDFARESEFFVVGARIAPGGIIAADPALEQIEGTFNPIRALAIGGAHLITARNVPVERVAFPRAQRRRMTEAEQERAGRVYFVNLAGSGEHDSASYGGGREYHCRWLVRGHWRHVDSGRSFCTCCDPQQIATWIEPYVKGPVGAPWKGKQVRR